MQPEPDMPPPTDLSVLDPGRRDAGHWQRAAAQVAQRALQARRVRRAVVRRGVIAVALASAAALGLWFLGPGREPAPSHAPVARTGDDAMLGWALRDPDPSEVLGYAEAGDAQ